MSATDQTPAEAFRAFLAGLGGISGVKMDKIVTEFESYLPGDVRALIVDGTAGVIEEIEAYGLLIGLDAYGRAAEVRELDERGTASWTPRLSVEYWEN